MIFFYKLIIENLENVFLQFLQQTIFTENIWENLNKKQISYVT